MGSNTPNPSFPRAAYPGWPVPIPQRVAEHDAELFSRIAVAQALCSRKARWDHETIILQVAGRLRRDGLPVAREVWKAAAAAEAAVAKVAACYAFSPEGVLAKAQLLRRLTNISLREPMVSLGHSIARDLNENFIVRRNLLARGAA